MNGEIKLTINGEFTFVFPAKPELLKLMLEGIIAGNMPVGVAQADAQGERKIGNVLNAVDPAPQEDDCESCFDWETCSVDSHKRAYTVKDEVAYICNHCDAISTRHYSAIDHHRKRGRGNECPRSQWPSHYGAGFEEYTRCRRVLNIETKQSARSEQEHQKLRNKMMHRYILRVQECSRPQNRRSSS